MKLMNKKIINIKYIDIVYFNGSCASTMLDKHSFSAMSYMFSVIRELK